METFSVFPLLFMILAGGNGDLLDHLSTEAYWKSKGVGKLSVEKLVAELKPPPAVGDLSPLIKALGSEDFTQREQASQKLRALGRAALPQLEKASKDPDPEVARRASELINQFGIGGRSNRVRKLMVIRALGEMGKAEALPVLKPLLDSKEMFVTEYAARAIAALEGKPAAVNDRKLDLSRDLALLPGDCGIVGQLRYRTGSPRTIDKMLEMLPAEVTGNQGRDVFIQKLVNALIEIAEQVGNVRLDALTLGVSENIGDRSGFVVLCARGQYDASAVQAMLAKTNFMSPEKVGDIQLWTPPNGRDAAFFFPSNEHAVFMAGPTRDQLPSQSMSEAFKAGQNPKGIKTNARIMKLMSSIDTTEALWGVAIIQGIFRKEIPQLEEFDSITLVGKREKAATIFEAKGEGKDTTKVAAAAGTINKQIEEARKNIADMAPKPMFPALKPILNFLESMKCEAQGTTATLKARFEGDNPGQLLMMLGFWTVAPIRAAPPPPPPNK